MTLQALLRESLARPMIRFRRGQPRMQLDRAALGHQRIAMVKLDGIGDFVLATTFLKICQDRWPLADITIFCRKPVGQLARQQFPHWQVVELPPRTRPLRDIYLEHQARQELKKQRPFDLLLDLRSFRDMADSAVASWIPARMKIALENAYRGNLSWVPLPGEERIYDQLLPLPAQVSPGNTQDIQNHRELAEWLFPEAPEYREAWPRLDVSTEDRGALTGLLRDRFSFEASKPFLLVCPGAGAPIREYPPAQLATAIERILQQTEVALVIAGGPDDRRTTAPLVKRLPRDRRILDLTDTLSLPQHVALVALSAAVLCMETSHAHIAGALKKRTVAIIGGGHYGLFAPWGESLHFRWLTHRVPCFGCHWQCIHSRPLCIQELLPEAIAQNMIALLQQP